MPITDTLENAERLERLGFSHEQSHGLAGMIEQAAHAGGEDLKAFIRQENRALRGEIEAVRTELRGEIEAVRTELRGEMEVMRAGLEGEIKATRNELRAEMKDQTLKALAIVVALLSLAVAVIKLFPNAY